MNGDVSRHSVALVHGMSVAPSGLLPSECDCPTDSFTAGCYACSPHSVIQLCLMNLTRRTLPAGESMSATATPQIHMWGRHVVLPRW